ncbi:hypothetical protein ACFV2H_21185 [Streptomyces sp. NPDC059629]|uniref:hypothetical protein n=1 Tax=Streptomyces sp. NPDC059629 TaxID=3346889 RepID=UPI0036B9D50B
MRATYRLHRLDLQRVVSDGEPDALYLPDQFPVGGDDLLVALAAPATTPGPTPNRVNPVRDPSPAMTATDRPKPNRAHHRIAGQGAPWERFEP